MLSASMTLGIYVLGVVSAGRAFHFFETTINGKRSRVVSKHSDALKGVFEDLKR